MPVDASIFARYLGAPKSVDQYSAEADNAEAGRLQLMLQRGQLGDQQRARAEQDRLMRLMQGLPGTASDEDRISALRGGGFLGQADALQKGALERQKTQAEVGKITTETGSKQFALSEDKRKAAIQQMASFRSPQDALQALDLKIKSGEVPAEMGEILKRSVPADPAQFPQWQLRMIAGVDNPSALRELLTPHLQTNNTGGALTTQAIDKATGMPIAQSSVPMTQSPDNRASLAVQMRGQNMVDARARETASQSLSKPFEVTGPEGTPILVQQDKQGNLSRVEGFSPKVGASKPMTEGQAKANLFGQRMTEANDILEGLAAKGVLRPSLIKQGAEAVPLVGAGLGMLANAVQSPEQQQVEQAQRDFINAVLRRESGAVIADSEFKNAERQYFPQPNDAPEVIAQKKRNRETAIKGILAEVPAAARAAVQTPAEPPQAAAPGAPQISGADLLKAADAIVGGSSGSW